MGRRFPLDEGGGDGGGATTVTETIKLFEPLVSDKYNMGEKIALIANVVVALGGLGYALMLVGQVRGAPTGTPKMQEIARAIREGADAYLFRQFRVVGVLIVMITGVLWWAATTAGSPPRNRRRPGSRLFGRLDVLRHGRLRRHAAGHGRELAGRRGGPA